MNDISDITNKTPGAARLREFVQKAAAGDDLVVVFFGGSITQGSLASSEETCYARVFCNLLGEHFPKSSFTYVNSGVGGTGSHYGAMRVSTDVLSYSPDLVVIDFSVNDTEAVLPLYGEGETAAQGDTDWSGGRNTDSSGSALKLYPETWEGVLRRILSCDSRPAVLVLGNCFYDTGISVEDEHNAIADHYGVPHMSVRDRILPLIREGRYTREDLSPDGLHPNDKGHRLIAEELMRLMLQYEESAGELPVRDEEALPSPLTANAYEYTERLDSANSAPELYGFSPDNASHENDNYNFFRGGWTASQIGDRFEIDVEGSGIAVVYRKTIHRPSPVARLVLDGDEEHAVILDGNFDQDWGDCLYLQPILHHGNRGRHHISIVITEATPGDLVPFYLLCIGVST
ncbi:MAG: SGNH/GDSL hydrolase family protein [Lachnospiraceae bacterium]|nr:SGNH/GDSL hydrolase family protein [Lachnospiraceae bacterium]